MARPNQQDRVLNDPSHPDNIYADATPETRAAIQQAKLAQARIEAGKWIAHRKGLAAIPDVPGFTDDPQGNIAGKAAGLPGQAVDATPGLGQIAGSDDVFGQTLKQLGIDTNDADKIAAATQDPAFQNALRGNLDRYWLGAAGDAVLDGGKSIFTGNATRWGRKKVLPKLVR